MAEPVASEPRAPSVDFDAVLFDLDGVVTRTARLHAVAWKELFDRFLKERAAVGGEPFVPFDEKTDYHAWVDGKPRHEGVRSFLASRGITLPEGDPADAPGTPTVQGLGAAKDALFKQRLQEHGVEVIPATVVLIRALRAAGVRTGVVTSSRNGRAVLHAAGIEHLFDAHIDGHDAAALGLRGKPHPDPFLACARQLDVVPGRAVVFEDAIVGVEAGRSGGFGFVVGVDRGGNREALAAHGADLVVTDAMTLDVAGLDARVRAKRESVAAWRVAQDGFDASREHEMESIFTVGNGYLGVRGAVDTPLPGSQADLFIAGVYDRKQAGQPYSEVEFLGPGRNEYAYTELVWLPFPFRVLIRADGTPLDLIGPHWRTNRRILDLREAVLHTAATFETDGARRTSVRTWRCASRADLHLLLQEITVCPENHSGPIELDASFGEPDLATAHPHLVAVPAGSGDDTVDIRRYRTRGSEIDVCVVTRTTLAGSGRDAVHWRVPGTIGEPLTFRRWVVVWTSRDGSDPHVEAVARVRALRWEDFDAARAAHAAQWAALWERADVGIVGSPATAQALRFNAYHLATAADRDPRVSVGGRALTGRAYEGHVFWDVEIFQLPFYLHTCPALARNLLLYRRHTLDGARRRARELGCRGACYAWESTVTGDDVTPNVIRLTTTGRDIPIFTGSQQVHITADVAHALWHYRHATGDDTVLRDAGVEILVETARFWASRSTPGPRHRHIRGVVGPDEYHHSVDDNAYTNWMARLNLEHAVEAVAWLRRKFPRDAAALADRLGLSSSEPEDWAAVARALYCPGPNADGVIEQFAGFFDLEDYPLPREERFKAPISRLFDWERLNRLKMIKQADVLMLLHLFPDLFAPAVVAANYRYYEPITDHGSSLSPGIHAAVAARLGLREDAERYWRQSLRLDLSNTMGNGALGIHPACMGATWQALVLGFLGVRFTPDGPVPDPGAAARLPSKWRAVALTLAWRGRMHAVDVRNEEAR